MNVELRDSKGELVKEVIIQRENEEEQPGAIREGDRIFVFTAVADTFPHPGESEVYMYREVEVHDLASPPTATPA